MFERYLKPFYAPPDDGGSGSPDTGSDDSLAHDLADLDAPDAESEEDTEDAQDAKDLGDDEEIEAEEELENDEEEKPAKKKKVVEDEEEEEAEEQPAYTSGPTYKDIKTKYPNLFKDFPQLKSAFFLAPKFMEIFSDPESAQQAATKSEEFDKLEDTLVAGGDPTLLLTTLSENSPKSLSKIAEAFGPTLRALDEPAYLKLTAPIIEELLYHADRIGQSTGNKNLALAARHIANFVFANGGEIRDITKNERRTSEKHPAEKALEEERATRAQEKFHAAASEISGVVSPELDKILLEKVEQRLSPFEKRTLLREAREEINDRLNRDTAFQSILKGLWKRAGDNNYSTESKTKIRRAWLERARSIAPGIRNRLLKEALDTRKGGKSDGDEATDKKRTFNGTGAKVGTKPKGLADPKKIAWGKMTDMDILNS